MPKFQLTGGSVIGRDHINSGKNNQDAYHFEQHDTGFIAVVADGCSSSQYSEVGAQLGVRIAAKQILNSVATREPFDEYDLEDARRWIITDLRVATELVIGGAWNPKLNKAVNDYMLFTLVGALTVGDRAFLFNIGDGFMLVNGEPVDLGQYPGNAPPYLGYAMVESSIDPQLLQFRVQEMPTADLKHFVIGTDGMADFVAAAERPLPSGRVDDLVGPVSQFWTDDRYFKNPFAVRRRLVLANGGVHAQTGYLRDDTTLIVGRQEVDNA